MKTKMNHENQNFETLSISITPTIKVVPQKEPTDGKFLMKQTLYIFSQKNGGSKLFTTTQKKIKTFATGHLQYSKKEMELVI